MMTALVPLRTQHKRFCGTAAATDINYMHINYKQTFLNRNTAHLPLRNPPCSE